MKQGNARQYVRLHTAIALFVCLVVMLSLSITGVLIGVKQAESTRTELADKAMTVAETVANTPIVIDALDGKVPRSAVESVADKLQEATHVRFIVVMDMNHIRLSHPDIDKIGKHFVGGDEDRAMKGEQYISTAEGTLGPSLRAFVPIWNASGKQVGVVSVGIMLDHVRDVVARSERIIYLGTGIGVVVGVVGALLLARKIKAILLGLEPHEIANLLHERNALLESVREGILAVDQTGKIVVANAEAVRMFERAGLRESPIGKNVEEYIPRFRFQNVLETGAAEYDEEHEVGGLTFVANKVPIKVHQHVVGAVATFRDKTELKKLAEQLTGVKGYAEALRVQTHEFMNKLHVILGLAHVGHYDRIASYIHEITDRYQIEVGLVSRLVKDPVVAGFLLSKLSYAREHNVSLQLYGDGIVPVPKDSEASHEFITLFGNLMDNAFEAVEGRTNKEIQVYFSYQNPHLSFTISDSGGGIAEEIQNDVFERGFSTKGDGRGYGLFLARKSIEKLHGTMRMTSGKSGTTFTVSMPYEEEGEPV